MITLKEILNIDYPIIVAPMFLVSNTKMIIAALEFGATVAFPALNYRSEDDLRNAIKEIKAASNKPFGVNLIVNQSNPKYKAQLKILADMKVDYIITSLGSPEETIKTCKPLGIKVFCDVINVEMAKKVEGLGADAVIAVNNKAGGHCGNQPAAKLIDDIKAVCTIPIISAGGIGTPAQLKEALAMGVAGVSIGTIFLACTEAEIGKDYRQALIDYGEKDIVLTTKISGSHLTVINTPYVQSIGTKATFLERMMNRYKFLKKYIKFIIFLKGMKMVKDSTFKGSYKTVWCAGPAIEHIKSIRPMKEILAELVS
jgi:nitronate monooxygenase